MMLNNFKQNILKIGCRVISVSPKVHTQCHEILATGDYARYAKSIQDESTVTISEDIEKNIVDWIAAL